MTKGMIEILGLMPVGVLNTGDYKPMDHAPMPHGGGSTDDQCAHGKRRTVPLIGVQPHVQVDSRPGKVREEERLRYQKIKRGSGIILHGGGGTKHDHSRIRPHPALSVVSMRYSLTNRTLSTVHHLSEEGGFTRNVPALTATPAHYPLTIIRSVCKPSPYAMLSKMTCRHTAMVNSTASSSRTCRSM
jgi:hypothetical protein